MALPKPLPKMTPEDLARFWALVDRRGPDECWSWMGNRWAKGYGRFKLHGRELKAHRVALFLTTGSDPGQRIVRHTCDWPPCCNPKHVLPGTPRENSADMVHRGRQNTPSGARHGSRTRPESRTRGERSGLAKVTTEQVLAMRAAYAAGSVTQGELGEQYGITRKAVSMIVRGKNWAHLPAAAGTRTIARSNQARSSRQNGGVKLTEAAVLAIRRRLAANEATRAQLAREYGVSWTAINLVATGQKWRHVPTPPG